MTINLPSFLARAEPERDVLSACSIAGRILLAGSLLASSAAQTLRSAGAQAGRLVGTAARSNLLTESPYTATLAREFSMLEPEDELKWEVLRPSPQGFDFTRADLLAGFAAAHGMKVRGHTLVWARQLPAWLLEQPNTPEQLRQLLHEHIQTVVARYRGRVFAWDVVNEAFDEHGRLRSTLWYDQPGIGAGPGPAYIEQALRWTHAADPAALLFLNDTWCQAINRKSDAIYALAQDFKRRGVPLDGIGIQMHLFDLHPDYDGIARNFGRFAALGLQLHITEMDVALPVDAAGHLRDPQDLLRQAEVYRRIASICLAQPACTAIQTWGFTDKYSWIPWASGHAQGAALLFDSSYAPKPAYQALWEALHAASPSPPARH